MNAISGNSVPPRMVELLARANCRHELMVADQKSDRRRAQALSATPRAGETHDDV